MRSRGRFAILASNTVFALLSTAVMFALVRAVTLEPPRSEPDEASQSEQVSAAEAVEREGRIVFVNPNDLPSPDDESDEADPALRSTLPPEAETTDPWTTEARPQTDEPQRRYSLLPPIRFPWQKAPPPSPQKRHYTLKARLAELSPLATPRLEARFNAAKAPWPPSEIALVAIKDEKALELHARQKGGAWKHIHRYRVLAASGGPGPKLRQGDRQVPEGIYAISFLNPNSSYHVSLRVNYPNAFDREMAAKEARKDLGGDIMIHGKNLSAGCLAVGDEAAEELFVLAAQTGLPNVKLIIAPTDLRHSKPPVLEGRPEWLPRLYGDVALAMTEFKAPPPVATASSGFLSFFTK